MSDWNGRTCTRPCGGGVRIQLRDSMRGNCTGVPTERRTLCETEPCGTTPDAAGPGTPPPSPHHLHDDVPGGLVAEVDVLPRGQVYVRVSLVLQGYTPITVDPLWANLQNAVASLLNVPLADDVHVLQAAAPASPPGEVCVIALAIELDSRDADAAITTLERATEDRKLETLLRQANGFSNLVNATLTDGPFVARGPGTPPSAANAHKTLVLVLSFIAALLTFMAVYCFCVNYKQWKHRRGHQLIRTSLELSDSYGRGSDRPR